MEPHSPERLRRWLPVGYRAKSLHALAARFSGSAQPAEDDLRKLASGALLLHLRGWPGFGPYAAAHVSLLLGVFDEIPVDSLVRDYVRHHYRSEDIVSCLARRYNRWGEYKWWGLKLDKMARHDDWIGD